MKLVLENVNFKNDLVLIVGLFRWISKWTILIVWHFIAASRFEENSWCLVGQYKDSSIILMSSVLPSIC